MNSPWLGFPGLPGGYLNLDFLQVMDDSSEMGGASRSCR